MNKRAETVKNRIKGTRAFTLAEALVTIIILLLVTAIVAVGIPAAMRAYDNVVVASNAEVLLSTSMSELRNALSTGREFRKEGKSLTYYNDAYGSISTISLAGTNTDKPGNILYNRYVTDPLLDDVYTDSGLVSEMASSDDLYATYDDISLPDNGIITITGLKILRKGHDDPVTKQDFLYIRVINSSIDESNEQEP